MISKILILLAFLQLSSHINCKTISIGDTFKFSYKNCGPSNDPLQIQALSVVPDPIHFPGLLNISATVSLAQSVPAPISVSLKIVKQVGPIPVEIPCVNNVGSCTYSDICTKLPPSPSQCPSFFIQHQLPCTCPFPNGNYGVQDLSLNVNINEPIPQGDYTITADISNNNNHIGCVKITATYK